MIEIKPLTSGLFVLAFASAAQAGTFSEMALTLSDATAADLSTGISSSNIYTHAIDLNSDDGGAVINGVTFTASGVTGPNFTLTGTTNFFQDNDTRFGNNLDPASGIYDLTEDFLFSSGAAAQGLQQLTLTGLTGGTSYITSFFTAGFAGAQQILDADDDGVGFNTLTTDRGDEKVITYSYTLPAGDTDIIFTFDAVNDADAFHQYGFANQVVVPEPASVALLGVAGLVLLRRRRRA